MTVQRVFRVVFCIGLLVVVIFSLEPRPPQVLLSQGDLVAHLAAYGALGLAAGLGWPGRLSLVLVAMPLCGFALELAQIPVPGRAFEWSDAMANTVGALLGVLAAWAARRVMPAA